MAQAQRAQQIHRELAVEATKLPAAAGVRALAAPRWAMVADDVEAHLSAGASATVTRAFMNERVLTLENPPNEIFVRLLSASVKRPPHFEAGKEFGT
jgi:hypothetical protein